MYRSGKEKMKLVLFFDAKRQKAYLWFKVVLSTEAYYKK